MCIRDSARRTRFQKESRIAATRDKGLGAGARKAPDQGWDSELLRSELFSIKQLTLHAAALAGRHDIDPHPGPDRLLPRLADNERVLLAAYDVVTAAARAVDQDLELRIHGDIVELAAPKPLAVAKR
jgi:hypothetical protein